MRKITEIIIHCSATPAGRHFTVQDIDRWHRAQGFSSIGYHYVIYLDGSIHPGRPVEDIGAHCLGHNAHSIGVCYIGGLDADTLEPADTRTPEQRTALRKLIAQLQEQYPGTTVHGHNEFADKACPCFRVRTEL
jgi:N-acetylmuramoyl-L-alanine amidase